MSSGPACVTHSVRGVLVAVCLAVFGVVAASSDTALAHDDIAGSTPASGSTVQEPISSVDVDFGAEISDDVMLFLTYDPGDGNVDELGGTTVRTGETTARIDFDEIERRGTYIVRYLAPVPTDGHVIAGALSFNYGEASSIGQAGFPVVPFVVGAVIVLAIGGWLSYRRMRAIDPESIDTTV